MKLKVQLSLILTVICIVLTMLFSVIIYISVKKDILDHIYSHLESVSETKKIRIIDMIERRFELIGTLANSPVLINEIKQFLKAPEKNTREEIIEHLERINRLAPADTEIHLTDSVGMIIASTDSSYVDKDYSQNNGYKNARKYKRSFVNDFFYKKEVPILSISSPVFNEKIMMATLIIERNATDFLTLTNDYTGLGKTGETYLGKIYNGKVVFLNPLRFDKNAALRRTVPSNDRKYALSIAVAKEEGLFTNVVDYRGMKIIASTRYISQTDWGLVTEMDQSEAFQSIHALRNKMLLITMVAIMITLIVAYYIAKAIARPVELLTESVNEISRGNFKKRISLKSHNEIGILCKSFNGMASALEQNVEDLRQSNDSLNKFAYVVSHDIKSPLNSIIAIHEIIKLEHYPSFSEDSKRWIDIQYDKAKEMEELIHGILLTAQKKQVANPKESVDLNKIVKKVVESLVVPDHISVEVKRTLPVVYHHKIPMMQVFQNLVGNAIKYCDKKTGKIEIDYTEEERQYRICIKDNGSGIKGEDFQKIFKMFESVEVEKKSTIDSSGIGLSVVKKIVEDNGGRVWLDSKVGVGSTFYFTIMK